MIVHLPACALMQPPQHLRSFTVILGWATGTLSGLEYDKTTGWSWNGGKRVSSQDQVHRWFATLLCPFCWVKSSGALYGYLSVVSAYLVMHEILTVPFCRRSYSMRRVRMRMATFPGYGRPAGLRHDTACMFRIFHATTAQRQRASTEIS